MVSALTALTKKENVKHVRFQWGSELQEAFDELETTFTAAPILRNFDYDRERVVEAGASDYVPTRILSQNGDKGILHLSVQKSLP